jgi:hypothetical protein
MNDQYGEEIPDEVAEYYRQVEREVLEETIRQDPVRSEVKLSTFVSASKGRNRKRRNRKRRNLKEITLIKYGRNYHQPHRFDWWTAGSELLGDDPDCEEKLQEIILGNQARNMNDLKTKLRMLR